MKESEKENSKAFFRRYKPYPAYKDSGVEWLEDVPKGWEIKILKRLFKVVNGSTPRSTVSNYWDGDIPWVTPDDLGEINTPYIATTARSITLDGYNSCSVNMATAGCVILSTRAPVGYVAIAGVDLCTNQGCRSLIPLKLLSSKYYYYLLCCATQELEAYGQGSTFRELSKTKLENINIPLPTNNEQKTIVNFLDRETAKIDALIAKQERLIELLQEKRAALITRAVTKGLDPNVPMKDSGVEWLGEIPAHWGIVPLKRLGEFQGGAGFPDNLQGHIDRELPFYKVSDTNNIGNEMYMKYHNNTISTETANYLRAFIFPKGTIVFPKVGAALLLNKRRILTRPSCIDNNMMGFIPCTGDLRWLYYWMCGLDLGRLANPGAVPSINESQLRDIVVPLPPEEEQRTIGLYLANSNRVLNKTVDKISKAVSLLKEYRTALISAAVTGKIDVRGEVSSA